MSENKRDTFGSSFGVIVALAGSAVGLGNLWRFPYLVGENGGAAFILIYLACVVLICLPILISEFLLGKSSHSSAYNAFKVLAPGSHWNLLGVIFLLCCICILAFYSVVGGWSFEYLFKACRFDFTQGLSSESTSEIFTQFTASPWKPLVFHIFFIMVTCLIVMGGIKNGIEKFSKVMMPLLFLLIIIIAVRSLSLPGAEDGISYLFHPDFSKVTGKTIMAALGQAFFSLSIGSGMVLTYASYTADNENILKDSCYTAVSDTIFAIIAGCAIMPAVFAFGISPSEGPGLVFVTLPEIFPQFHLGGVIAIFFFICLILAALTSSISMVEVVVAFAMEKFNISRKIAVLVTFIIVLVLGTLSSLSLGVLSDIKLFGFNFFDFFDNLSANILMPIGGLLLVIFAGWRFGKVAFVEELTNRGSVKIPARFINVLFFLVKYIVPVAVILIMAKA